MKPKQIKIKRWFDRHLHVRDGAMMETVLPCTINQRATGAIIMPNLPDPITTCNKARGYHDRIMRIVGNADFTPCMTLYLTDQTDPAEVGRGFRQGAISAVKLYMANQNGEGGTTGSAHGVRNLRGCYRVFEMMERYGIPLLGHFEAVEEEVDEFDREVVSVERDLIPIIESFPALPIVFEHITDGRAADFVAQTSHNIQATVTPQHLMLNRNALFWKGLAPLHWCKPVLKREEHRRRIRSYVTSGHPRFGAGTDSAPHDKSAKSRCCGCAAGIFTAPVAVEMYASIFDEDCALNNLEAFLSENFLDLYGMEVSYQTMTLERTEIEIPESVGNVLVLNGGKKLPWRLVS